MNRLRIAAAGHGLNAAVLVVVLVMLMPVQAAMLFAPKTPSRSDPPVASVRIQDEKRSETARGATPDADPTKTQQATAKKASPTKEELEEKRLSVFRGLGAWVDVYDFGIDHVAALRRMKANSVRTLYIQTGRYNTEHAVAPQVGPWLAAAHELDIQVVGWYLPSYKRVGHDVKRTVAAARYRFAGEKLDAIGIDVEFKGEVRNVARWNRRVAKHSRLVREALGKDYPIGGIVFPPVDMTVAPATWEGFPWRSLAKSNDVFLVMGYWSNRDCPRVPLHCAYRYTVENVKRAQRFAGRDIPVHVIGGIGDQITDKQLRAFVRAARDVKAFGASLYDYRTTDRSFWPTLRKLRSL